MQKQKLTVKLKSLPVHLPTGTVQFSELAQEVDLRFPAPLLNLEASVFEFKAVVSEAQQLVNVYIGDYVRFQGDSKVT